MSAEFYDREIEEPVFGGGVEKKIVTFFRLVKASMADKKAEPFEFDGPATEAHKKGYAKEFSAFQKSKEVVTEMEEAAGQPTLVSAEKLLEESKAE